MFSLTIIRGLSYIQWNRKAVILSSNLLQIPVTTGRDMKTVFVRKVLTLERDCLRIFLIYALI